MIQKSAIKNFVQKELKKKIGDSAIKKLNSLIDERIKELLKKASRKADISGRVIIKEQDII